MFRNYAGVNSRFFQNDICVIRFKNRSSVNDTNSTYRGNEF
jgi:hypothetical protein